MITKPAVFEAISDPTRRAILDSLRLRDRAAGEIASLFPVSRPAISKHLRVLRAAGLVRHRQVAQSRIYSLEPEPLRQVERWLEHYRVFWAARLHDLKRFVETTDPRNLQCGPNNSVASYRRPPTGFLAP
jgi:DNA-binding transcriptional ArsR family regulator